MESSNSRDARIEPCDTGAQSDESVNSYRIPLSVEQQFKLSIERVAVHDNRKPKSRIHSARYYAAHKDAVKERMRKHAQHKRFQLDESVKATRAAMQSITRILITLSETLNALEEKRKDIS